MGKPTRNSNRASKVEETVVETSEVLDNTNDPVSENIVSEFVNPFKAGVSYNDFINALGNKSVSEYLNGQFKTDGVEFTSEDIEWLTQEVETHKNK